MMAWRLLGDKPLSKPMIPKLTGAYMRHSAWLTFNELLLPVDRHAIYSDAKELSGRVGVIIDGVIAIRAYRKFMIVISAGVRRVTSTVVKFFLHRQDSENVWWTLTLHDDVINWKHFPRNWPFVRGIHRSPVNSPHKGQWRGALLFSLICVWINDWVNNREAGDLRRYRARYDVIAMTNLHTFIHKRKYDQQFIILTSGHWNAFEANHRSLMDSSHKGSEMWHLMLSSFLAWTSCCTHSRDAGDLTHHDAHWWFIKKVSSQQLSAYISFL